MTNKKDSKSKRRSGHWFGGMDKEAFIHRSWMRNQGHPHHVLDGRPVIGIGNTYARFTPCNAHLRELVEEDVGMYVQHVVQANEGADLDFLRRCRGHGIPCGSH